MMLVLRKAVPEKGGLWAYAPSATDQEQQAKAAKQTALLAIEGMILLSSTDSDQSEKKGGSYTSLPNVNA
jgi:hypothetical protein